MTYLNLAGLGRLFHPIVHSLHWRHCNTAKAFCMGFSCWLTEANISSTTFSKSSISLAKLYFCTLFIICDPPFLAGFVIILKRDVDRTARSVPNIVRHGHLFLFTLGWEDLFLSKWNKLCPLRVIDIFLQDLQYIFQTSVRSFNWLYGEFY